MSRVRAMLYKSPSRGSESQACLNLWDVLQVSTPQAYIPNVTSATLVNKANTNLCRNRSYYESTRLFQLECSRSILNLLVTRHNEKYNNNMWVAMEIYNKGILIFFLVSHHRRTANEGLYGVHYDIVSPAACMVTL